MVKRKPFMYLKKCEKTFEILRSEITFLMDLYTIRFMPCIDLWSVIVHFLVIFTCVFAC